MLRSARFPRKCFPTRQRPRRMQQVDDSSQTLPYEPPARSNWLVTTWSLMGNFVARRGNDAS